MSGAVKIWFCPFDELEDDEEGSVVSVACVPAGRMCGLGRIFEDGMVIVKEGAAAAAAVAVVKRMKERRDRSLNLGSCIVVCSDGKWSPRDFLWAIRIGMLC